MTKLVHYKQLQLHDKIMVHKCPPKNKLSSINIVVHSCFLHLDIFSGHLLLHNYFTHLPLCVISNLILKRQ